MAVVVKECAYALVHVPSFVRYGSKPIRDIADAGGPGCELEQAIYRRVRPFDEAVAYPPNQVFIGNLHPLGCQQERMPSPQSLTRICTCQPLPLDPLLTPN